MIPEQSCVNCHFFVKKIYHNPFVIKEDIRISIRKEDFSWIKDHYSLCCHFGIWDEGHNFDRGLRYKVIVQKNRKDSCFFFKYRPGMLLPAAEKLREEKSDKTLKKSKQNEDILILQPNVYGFGINLRNIFKKIGRLFVKNQNN